MRIYIANDSKMSLGGGWTFIRNFRKAMGDVFTDDMEKADVVFYPSASMVNPATHERAVALKKRIVLRIDNIPRNSRNRNTGTSRLLTYARGAKAIVYQSRWAQEYVGDWIQSNLPVPMPLQSIIYNGVDTDIFKPEGERMPKDSEFVALYSRYNRDETKGWHIAWYEYQMKHRANPNWELWLVGQFSPELVEYNFDFYNNELVHYWGVVEDPNAYVKLLRTADILFAPYYNDACSNCILEALHTGVAVDTLGMGHTGGTKEIIDLFYGGRRFGLSKMGAEYKRLMESL